MNLNPVTAIADKLEKLIIEHGSAAVQEKHIGLLKDQLNILSDNFKSLELENKKLKSENEDLHSLNEELNIKISELEKPTIDTTVNAVDIEILKYLSVNPKSIELNISQTINSTVEATKFYLKELESRKFVRSSMSRGRQSRFVTKWSLDHEGRRYLVDNKMIS